MSLRSQRWALPLLASAATFAAARAALHATTFALPLSNDDAIPMIQSWLLLQGQPTTTLINQPYNGTLDSWLMAPGLLFLSPHAVFRLYELAGGAALVVVCAWMASRLGGYRAAVAAGLLAAFGTPYMALMTAVGPVPNFLVPVLVALALGLSWTTDPPRAPYRAALGGLVAGLATWDSALALPSVLGALAGLAAARGLRVRSALGFAAGFAAGVSPLLLARTVGAAGRSTVTARRSLEGVWTDGLHALGDAASGLFGLSVPLVVDGPERAALPVLLAAGLGLALVAAVGVGAAAGRGALPIVGWAVALGAAFALSSRTGSNEVRYLYGLAIPVLVLAAAGLERLHRRRAWAAYVLVAPILVAWAIGHGIVLRHWRDPRHAAIVWQVPPLTPALTRLDALEIGSVYASLQFAGRVTVESSFRRLASQAWNERIPGDPLRFRDEVDLDPRAAWLLSPRWSRGMPRAAGFRALLADMGGTWREEALGEMVLFHGFEPPFDERRSVPRGAVSVQDAAGAPLPSSLLDRDVATAWTSDVGLGRGAGLVVRVSPPRRLSALVLGVDLARSPLAVPWVATLDGAVVASGPRRQALQWVGGVPRAAKQALLTIVFPARAGGEVRVLFQGNGPALSISEVFAYGPDEAAMENGADAAAGRALAAARPGRWDDAVRLYQDAVRREPDRASLHAALARARHRAAGRRHLDVESLDDGGAEIVGVKP
jgi:hypothetical protein